MKKVCKVCAKEVEFGSNVNATTCPACLEAGYKYCSKCSRVLPLSAFKAAGKSATGATRYAGECKDCAKQRSAKYYSANKERIKQQTETYRKMHLPKYVEYSAKYKNNHPIKRCDQQRAAYSKYSKTPHGKIVIKRHNEAYNRQAKVGDLTATQWQAILEIFNYTCAYCSCGGKLTMDHIIPVSKGGTLTKSNIIPACQHCNSSRRDKDIHDWLQGICSANREKVLWYINEGHKAIE